MIGSNFSYVHIEPPEEVGLPVPNCYLLANQIAFLGRIEGWKKNGVMPALEISFPREKESDTIIIRAGHDDREWKKARINLYDLSGVAWETHLIRSEPFLKARPDGSTLAQAFQINSYDEFNQTARSLADKMAQAAFDKTGLIIGRGQGDFHSQRVFYDMIRFVVPKTGLIQKFQDDAHTARTEGNHPSTSAAAPKTAPAPHA